MSAAVISARDIKSAIERKAFAYGISEPVSILLGEYVIELIKHLYGKQNTKQLVPKTLR